MTTIHLSRLPRNVVQSIGSFLTTKDIQNIALAKIQEYTGQKLKPFIGFNPMTDVQKVHMHSIIQAIGDVFPKLKQELDRLTTPLLDIGGNTALIDFKPVHAVRRKLAKIMGTLPYYTFFNIDNQVARIPVSLTMLACIYSVQEHDGIRLFLLQEEYVRGGMGLLFFLSRIHFATSSTKQLVEETGWWDQVMEELEYVSPGIIDPLQRVLQGKMIITSSVLYSLPRL